MNQNIPAMTMKAAAPIPAKPLMKNSRQST